MCKAIFDYAYQMLTNLAFQHYPRLFACFFIAPRPAFAECFKMRQAFVKLLKRIVELINQLSGVMPQITNAMAHHETITD